MAERMGIFQNTFINDDKEKFLEESTKYIIRDLYGLDRWKASKYMEWGSNIEWLEGYKLIDA